MAFETLELSNYDGAPIQLYEFQRTSGGIDFFWRYCTADINVVYGGDTYKAVAILDDGVKQDSESADSQFVITMPVAEDLPQMFRTMGAVPSDIIFCRLRRMHAGDGDARLFWMGTVIGVSQVDEVAAKVTCQTLVASFKRGGLRLGWTRGCPHVLYDGQCRADRETFNIEATVDSFNGTEVTSADFATQEDGWLDGGYLEWVLPSGITERRGIISHLGGTITLSGVTFGLADSDPVVAFAGCLRTRTVCHNKFNNLPNYGGFADQPGKSPFDGDPVF